MIAKNYLWLEASYAEIDAAVDSIEKYACSKTYVHIYSAKGSDDALQDAAFLDKMRALSDLQLSELLAEGDLEKVAFGEDESLESRFHLAIEYLILLGKAESPAEKLDAIHLFIKSAAETLGNQGADLLLPMLAWIVLRLSPPHIISDVRFVQRFRNASRITGEVAYCLTNMVFNDHFVLIQSYCRLPSLR